MAIVRITNGFHNHGGVGIVLTGILIEGEITKGDELILDEGKIIPILIVEFDTDTFPGINHVRLTVSRDDDTVWNKLYGKELKIKH